MEEISGYVEHIIYKAEQSGYKVMSFSTSEEDIIVVGIFVGVEESDNLIVRGDYVEHPTYGRQFKAQSFKITMPSDIAGIEHYLASGSIKGIGKVTAKRIVAAFGEDTFRIMEEEPEKLSKIKGISLSKAMDIADQVIDKRDYRDAIVYLDSLGIGSALAGRIFAEYDTAVYKVIKENPYRLAEEIEGVGFKIADSIALKMNMSIDSDYRISAAILYGLSRAVNEGHTYVMKDKLHLVVERLINIHIDTIEPHLMNLVIGKKIVIDDSRVYLTSYYYMESACADMLLKLDDTYDIDSDNLREAIKNTESKLNITLDDLQKEAIRKAISKSVCVLTGGPGTGKTTTIRTIIEYFELLDISIALAAPTGRAAKRMTEATLRGAKTIHRLLEVKGALEGEHAKPNFERNADNPIEADVVIIDEMSMVDITLFYHLLSAIKPGSSIIMVGDTNQLPSVGAGNVLRDIITSNRFSQVTLDRVFRQSDKSRIILNAYNINNSIPVDLDAASDDFFFVESDNAMSVTEHILSLINDTLPKYVDTSVYNIQVLTPSKKGYLGTIMLNKTLQDKLNAPAQDKAEYTYGDTTFRVGDKVMQIKNNYQLEWDVYANNGVIIDSGTGVFNGDMGVVTMIDKTTSTLRVMFDDDRSVDYTFAGLNEIEHAYAVTVHKSQGSEYAAVIIPLLKMPEQLMTRNILYTAITRAKKCVYIIGSKEIFYYMADNVSEAMRNSSLDRYIKK